MDKKYTVVNDTYYDEGTPNEVIKILENARRNKTRVRLFFGDLFTGEDWLEEFYTIGYIGRSSGIYKVPLLLSKENSNSGGAILTNRIVRITIDKQEVYRNKNYKMPSFEIKENVEETKREYPFGVYSKEKNIANFKTKEKAERYIAFLRGERN